MGGGVLNGVYHLYSEDYFQTKWAKDGGAPDEVPTIFDSSNEFGKWSINYMEQEVYRADETQGGALPTVWTTPGGEPVEGLVVEEYSPWGTPSPHRTVSATKGIKKFVKDPDSVEDYTVDWTDKYNETEETIMSEFIVPEGLSVEYEIFTGKLSTVWLSGGEVNKRYGVTNRVTTNEGRVYDKSIVIECQHQ